MWFQNRRTKSKREQTEGEGGGEGGERGGRDESGDGSGNGGEDEELDIIDYDDEDDYVDQLKMRHAAALAAINQSNNSQSINNHSPPSRQSPPMSRDLKDHEMKESQNSPPSLFTSLPKHSPPPPPMGATAVNLSMTSSEAAAARPQQLTASTHPLAVHALTLRADNQAASGQQLNLAANNKSAFSLSGSSQAALNLPLNNQAAGSLQAASDSLQQGLNLAAGRSLPTNLNSIWTLIPKSTSSEKI